MIVTPSRRLAHSARAAFAVLALAFGLMAGSAAMPGGAAKAATLLETLATPNATPVDVARHRRHSHPVRHVRHHRHKHHHYRHHRHRHHVYVVRRPLYCANDFVRLCGPYTCKIDPRRHCWR